MVYKFSISFLMDGTIRTHTEISAHTNNDAGYGRFQNLCEEFDVGPYYYLCYWREV